MPYYDFPPSLTQQWQQTVGAFSDPALRSTPGGFTQYAWASYQQAYLAQGLEPPPLSFQQMNQFISATARVANTNIAFGDAARRVQLSGVDRAITERMVAPDVDARSPSAQPLGPNTRVRFTIDVNVGGMALSQWVTYEAGLAPPQTVQSMLDTLDAAGSVAADKYNMEYDGLGGQVFITQW